MQRRSYLSHLSVFKYNKDQEDLFNIYISKETTLLEFGNKLDRNDQLILLTFVESDPIKLLAILSKNMSIDKIKNLTQPYAQKYLRQLHGNMYKKLQSIRNNKETSTFGDRIQFEIQNPEISDEWIKGLLDFPTPIKYPYLKRCVNFSIKGAGQLLWDYKIPSLEDLEIGGKLFKEYTNSNDARCGHPFLNVTNMIQQYMDFGNAGYAEIENDQQFYEIFEIAHKIIILNFFTQKINSNLLDEFQEKFKLCQNSNDGILKPVFHTILLEADEAIKKIRNELQVNAIKTPTLVSWQLNKILSDLKKNEKPTIKKKQPTFDPKSTRGFPQFIYEHLKQLKSQDFKFGSSIQNEIQDSSQVTEDGVKGILGLESPIQDKTGVLKKLVYNSIQLINTKLHRNSIKIKEGQNIFTLLH